MLLPKRTKYRKQQRGRMKGQAHRGNFVAYGDYGSQIRSKLHVSQSTDTSSVAVRYGSRSSLISRYQRSLHRSEWVQVRQQTSTGAQ